MVGSLSLNSIIVVIFAFPINTTMFWPQFNRSDSTFLPLGFQLEDVFSDFLRCQHYKQYPDSHVFLDSNLHEYKYLFFPELFLLHLYHGLNLQNVAHCVCVHRAVRALCFSGSGWGQFMQPTPELLSHMVSPINM